MKKRMSIIVVHRFLAHLGTWECLLSLYRRLHYLRCFYILIMRIVAAMFFYIIRIHIVYLIRHLLQIENLWISQQQEAALLENFCKISCRSYRNLVLKAPHNGGYSRYFNFHNHYSHLSSPHSLFHCQLPEI